MSAASEAADAAGTTLTHRTSAKQAASKKPSTAAKHAESSTGTGMAAASAALPGAASEEVNWFDVPASKDLLVAAPAVIGVLAFILYALTAHPTIQGGDSGELAAQACNLGVPHPPGYPLLTILNGIAARLPTPFEPAWAMNMLGACFSAVAAAGVVAIVQQIVPHAVMGTACAMFVGGVYATSPLPWLYASATEVFPMNQAFAVVILWLAVVIFKTKSAKYLTHAAFICGLAMTNQHTIVLIQLPLIIILLVRLYKAGQFSWLLLAKCAGAYLSALVLYAYLPLSHAINPHGSGWGATASVTGFLRHVARADFGSFKLFAYQKDTESWFERTEYFITDLFKNYSVLLTLLVLVAAVHAVKSWWVGRTLPYKSRRAPKVQAPLLDTSVVLIIMAALLFYVVVFHSLANMPLNEPMYFGVHRRFWILPNLMSAICIGVGIAAVWEMIPQRTNKLVSYAFCAVLAAGAVFHCYQSYSRMDMSKNEFVSKFGDAYLEAVPENAIVITADDLKWGSLQYLQDCLGKRPDVTVLSAPLMSYEWFGEKHHLYPNVTFPGRFLTAHSSDDHVEGQGFALTDFLRANFNQRPLLFDGMIGGYTAADVEHEKVFDFVPFSVGRLVTVKNETISSRLILESWYPVATKFMTLPTAEQFPSGTWEEAVREFLKIQSHGLAAWMINTAGQARERNVTDPDVALRLAHAAQMFEWRNALFGLADPPQLNKDLGLIFYSFATLPVIPTGLTDVQFLLPGWRKLQAPITENAWRENACWVAANAWDQYLKTPTGEADPQGATFKQAMQSCVQKFM